MVLRVAVETPPPGTQSFRRRLAPPQSGPILQTAWGPAFLFIYLLTIFLPGTFGVGPVRMTLFKLILVVAFLPLALHWIRGLSGRITVPDLLFLGFCSWVSLATLAVHGMSQVFYVGSTFVEYFGAYLVGRVLIRNADDYKRLFRYFLIVLVAMLPFAVVETVTRIRLLPNVMGIFMSQGGYQYENAPRLGLTRVAVGFNHPILWGVVCGLGFANVYYIYRDKLLQQVQATALVVFMTSLSISSGPLLALGLQGMMITWDRILRVLRSRWILAVVIGGLTFTVLQVTLPGGIVGYVVNEVIFNPAGGQTRITAFMYGSAEVLRNPFFGIGLNEYRRPWWEHSSIDNFWLVIAVRHGLPALLLLVLTIGMSAIFMMIRPGLDEREARYRTGYLIAFTGLVMALATVHIWAGALVFVMTYLGAGVWFYARKDPDGAPERMQRERRSLAPQVPPAMPDSGGRRPPPTRNRMSSGPASVGSGRATGLNTRRTQPLASDGASGTNRTVWRRPETPSA